MSRKRTTPRLDRHRPQRPIKKRLGLWAMLAVAILLGGYILVLVNSRPAGGGDRLRLDTFVTLVKAGNIKTARVLDQDEVVVGEYTRADGSLARYNAPYLANMGEVNVSDLLLQNNVATTVDHQFTKRLLVPITLILPALIVVVVFIYLILSFQQGSGLFSIRSGARKIDSREVDVTFADVAGQDAAIAELREIRDFLTQPDRFTAIGARVPKGVLLYGPPGCGKTLLARALAGEAGAAFFSISGSDFVELYVGVGAARVRDLFREAREQAPAIVFIDELDSVGRRRGGGKIPGAAGTGDEQDQALNQILAELDGFSPLEGIIVVAATNRPDILDPALLRPGRFDRTIGLERPGLADREAILAVHTRGMAVEADIDWSSLAQRATGLSGADLASVTNEAALLAARSGRATISATELDQALARILEAPERQRRLSMRSRTFGRSTGGARPVGFADVAGAGDALAALADVRDYLVEPERFAAVGARPPRGFLLVGPPGTGKTLLARALAGEANAAFFSVAATEFVEVFAGEGAARVRDLFAEARACAPSVVFLDEIDAIGARRVLAVGGHRESEQTLNQILVELDGFEARSGVIVLGATNRADILDPALVRPGRFDRTITVGLPDRGARRSILAVHARDFPLSHDVDLAAVAALTPGFTGADLAAVLNDASLIAARTSATLVPMAAVLEAVEDRAAGSALGPSLSDDDRAILACHAVGHAIVAASLPGTDTPLKVSLFARCPVPANALAADGEERVVETQTMLIDRMAVLLAGRAAEEMMFGELGSGSADDLRRVGEIGRRMVCQLGMSDTVGPIDQPERNSGPVEIAVRRLVDEADELAHAVLHGGRTTLERAAHLLAERETLTPADLEAFGLNPLPAARTNSTRASITREGQYL